MNEFGQVPPTTTDFYKIIKNIGKGAFAKVVLAEHKLTGKPVAIKIIKKSSIKDKSIKKKVLMEVYIQKKMKHQNIIKVLEVFEHNEHLFIVLEYGVGLII